MRRALMVVTLAVAVLGLVAPVSAQPASKVNSVGWFGDFGLVSSQVDSTTADEARIGSRGIGLMMGFGMHIKGIVVGGVQLEGQWVSDKDQFTNATTGGTKKSGTSIYDLSVFGGLRTPFLGDKDKAGVRLGVNYGKSWFGGRRGIGNCINCDEEGLNIGGGSYYEPIVIIGKRNVGCSVSYRVYGKESDVRNMFIISVAALR